MKTETSAPANSSAPQVCEHAAVPELGSSPFRAEAALVRLRRYLDLKIAEAQGKAEAHNHAGRKILAAHWYGRAAALAVLIQDSGIRTLEETPARNGCSPTSTCKASRKSSACPWSSFFPAADKANVSKGSPFEPGSNPDRTGALDAQQSSETISSSFKPQRGSG
jgi:hypothetical protein